MDDGPEVAQMGRTYASFFENCRSDEELRRKFDFENLAVPCTSRRPVVSIGVEGAADRHH